MSNKVKTPTPVVKEKEPKKAKFYRMVQISTYEYQLLAVEADINEAHSVGQADLKSIVMGKLTGIINE